MSAVRAPRVLVVGDVMTDISVRLTGPIAKGSDRRARISVQPGGSAATQAVWMARHGLDVALVARVGAADFERESARLRAAGVEPHLATDPGRESGRLVALVDPSGERSFLTDRGANDALCAEDIPDALIAGCDHLHLSGYALFAPSPRAAALSLLRRAGGRPVSVDPASAAFLREAGPQRFLDDIAGAAMLFPNEEEAAVLTGDENPEGQGAALAARFALVVIKRGAAGCEARRDGQVWRTPAPPAEAVDTTGAGDAFLAAFLAAHLKGAALEAALAAAVAAGSAATEFVGGHPPGR